jgi:hypothetical protein
MPQVSATLKDNTAEVLKDIASENERSVSSMISLIITQYAAHWIKSKSSAKNKTKK